MRRLLALLIFTLLILANPAGQAASVMFVPGHFSMLDYSEQTSTQIAADTLGNVYVPNSYVNVVYEYGPGAPSSGIFAGIPFNNYGASGDGGPATSAVLFNPLGIARDRSGNFYIADSWHNEIRRVDNAGFITTIASISQPTSVAVDLSENVYATTATQKNVVYKVSASGSTSIFAGTGNSGYSGDGGPATEATFGVASCVAVDPQGNLYVADSANNVVRKIDLVSNTISAVAGTGTAGYTGDGGAATQAELKSPSQIAFDAAGDLYVADVGNGRIRRVSAFDHSISTVVGGGSLFGDGVANAQGSALDVSLSAGGLAIDANGNLWNNGFYGTERVTATAEPALFEATLTGQTSMSHSYTVVNISASAVAISSIQVTGANAGDFGERNNCPATLAGGQSCSIDVSFTPSEVGTRTASVQVIDNSADSPHQISLTGIGIGPVGAPVAFGPVSMSASSTQQVSIAIPPSGGTSVNASVVFGTEF